jgi:hypothetical protein
MTTLPTTASYPLHDDARAEMRLYADAISLQDMRAALAASGSEYAASEDRAMVEAVFFGRCKAHLAEALRHVPAAPVGLVHG